MALITYWGKLADLVGTASETHTLPEDVRDTQTLRRWLDGEKSGHGVLMDPANRIAVNDEIVAEPAPVSDQDQLAFLPPVGGG
ncbi:MAG: MoaD/ThiS family protein [Pseudomonadota bacterium]